jgi:HAD superfamily hydrolase (TIGR01450 family)
MMEQQGLQVVGSEHDDDRIPDALIVALDCNLTYDRLRLALGAILGGAAFYSVNRDPRLPVEDGFVPGTGSITAALEYASGQKATIIGKPEPGIVVEAMRILGVSPAQTLMVGDGLDLDIVAGRAAGVTTALVLTGLTTGEEASRSTGMRRPHVVYKGLIDLLDAAKATARAASS